MNLFFVVLALLAWAISQDLNLAEYLYIQFFLIPLGFIRLQTLKYKMLFSLKWERFLMKRGHVPKKYMDMAREIRSKD